MKANPLAFSWKMKLALLVFSVVFVATAANSDCVDDNGNVVAENKDHYLCKYSYENPFPEDSKSVTDDGKIIVQSLRCVLSLTASTRIQRSRTSLSKTNACG